MEKGESMQDSGGACLCVKNVCMHGCAFVCMCVSIFAFLYSCVFPGVCVCLSVCLYVCVCVWQLGAGH